MSIRLIKAALSRVTGRNEILTGTNITYNNVDKHALDVNPLVREGTGEVKAFFNETHGFDMNQNGATGGTPEGVHNGTDSTLWAASALSGSWNFASTAQAHSGTKSIDATGTKKDEEALFEDATSTDMTNYVVLTGWIYITAWAENGDNEITIRARLNGTNVGNAVNLSDYISKGTFNIWQKFVIPKDDLGLSTQTVDELVVKTVAVPSATPPNYYLDDIQWDQTGGSVIFEINPSDSTVYYVNNMIFLGVATFDSRTATPINGFNISYNNFFGINKLSSGLVSTTRINNVTTFVGVFLQHADFMLIPYTDITMGGNGTTTWYRYQTKFDRPIKLDSTTSDRMRFTINDDLSSMAFFRIFTNGVAEDL